MNPRYIIKGAPIKVVVKLTGNSIGINKNLVIWSAAKVIKPPIKIELIMILCGDVGNNFLAIWGETKPINPIKPPP